MSMPSKSWHERQNQPIMSSPKLSSIKIDMVKLKEKYLNRKRGRCILYLDAIVSFFCFFLLLLYWLSVCS